MVPALPRMPEMSTTDHQRVSSAAERIAHTYAPAYVIVDDADEVVLASPGSGRFLASAGAGGGALPTLVHPTIAPELRRLMRWSRQTGRPGRVDALVLPSPGGAIRLTLAVEPLPAPDRLMVLFQDASADPGDAGHDRLRVDRLERHLRLSGDRLQSATRELAIRNHDYQVSTEDLQTSNEELAATGEELRTANDELASRVEQLDQVNSDIRHMLLSTRIAIVFLDGGLHIRSFTPAMCDIFRLIDQDLGRPITDIAGHVHYPELAADVQQVLRTREIVEREVDGHRGARRYLVRLLPYLDTQQVAAGVVVAFIDFSAAHQSDLARQQSEERYHRMAASVPAFLFIATPAGGWDYVNPPFYSFTGMAATGALGTGWMAAIHPEERAVADQLWRFVPESAGIEHEIRIHRADGTWCWFLLRAVPQMDGHGQVACWHGSCTDIDQRRGSEARQGTMLAELQHRVKNILALVRSLLIRTLDSSSDLDHFSHHFSGRIDALARVQTVAGRTPERFVMLDELVAEELAGHGGQNGNQTQVDGPDVALPEKMAGVIGLAMHELTTNALKYGGLSIQSGRVGVQWRLDPLEREGRTIECLTLDWRETGVPLTDLAPTRRGFGRELIEQGLPYELGAATTLEFRPGGVHCRIVMDMTGRPTPATSFGVAW